MKYTLKAYICPSLREIIHLQILHWMLSRFHEWDILRVGSLCGHNKNFGYKDSVCSTIQLLKCYSGCSLMIPLCKRFALNWFLIQPHTVYFWERNPKLVLRQCKSLMLTQECHKCAVSHGLCVLKSQLGWHEDLCPPAEAESSLHATPGRYVSTGQW